MHTMRVGEEGSRLFMLIMIPMVRNAEVPDNRATWFCTSVPVSLMCPTRLALDAFAAFW